jgi:branched-chain amino acid transport system substrate-binding protein
MDRLTGLPLQNAVQMAIDNANNNHNLPAGYSLKLITYNDVGKGNRSDPDEGVSKLNQAIADNLIAGVIGPYYSAVADGELPIANQAPIALISPSTTYDCLTNDVNNDPNCSISDPDKKKMRPTDKLTFFQLATIGSRVGKAAADYFINVQHHKHVVLIDDASDPYIRKLADGFQHEWERILPGLVTQLHVSNDGSDFQTYQDQLQSLIPIHPDLIYFIGRDVNGADALQALSRIPEFKNVPFAGDGNIADAYFLQAAGRIHPSAPVYANLPFQDPAHSGIQEGTTFERDYELHGYTDYRFHAASAYAAAMLLIQAINTALQQKGVSTPLGPQDQTGGRNFRQAVLRVLADPHFTYTGITGTHKFDANGDTTNHAVSFYKLDLSGQQPTWIWLDQVNDV